MLNVGKYFFVMEFSPPDEDKKSSSGIYACGQDGSYDLLQANRKPAWSKQEKEPIQICIGF